MTFFWRRCDYNAVCFALDQLSTTLARLPNCLQEAKQFGRSVSQLNWNLVRVNGCCEPPPYCVVERELFDRRRGNPIGTAHMLDRSKLNLQAANSTLEIASIALGLVTFMLCFSHFLFEP